MFTGALAELIALRQRRREGLGRDNVPLAERAQEVTDALTKAGELLEELQTEVKARSVIIDGLASQTKEAEQRAEDAVRRAALNEEQAKAVDAYLDRALKNRLTELERTAGRREWVIGTVVCLIVGIASILFAHFLFGF
jgi:polyhydroxyalkanoate synthesis regulator phasin